MTHGALIFAFNNGVIDYVKLAAWSANNIKRHLNIPVALVTDTDVKDPIFDRVISADKQMGNGRYFADFDDAIIWHNQNRSDAYDLSPWDKTLVLDADYIVASDQLQILFESDHDFLAHRWAYDVTGSSDFTFDNHFGKYGMPMWWATVMYFQKTQTSKLIFDSMRMIKNNWNHYCDLYGSRKDTFRNDFALSISLNLVNGHTQPGGIPWKLASLIPRHTLRQIGTDRYRVEFVNSEGQNRWMEIKNQDFHAMGKRDLESIVAS